MDMIGKFRVADTWQGAAKNGKDLRASATLNDVKDGGQVKVSFPNGVIPSEFVFDALVENLHVKPSLTNFGLMLSFIGFVRSGK